MRRSGAAKAGIATGLLVVVTLLLAGCEVPCELDADCPVDMHCGEERFCDKQCDGARDCDISEFCDRGRCNLDARPVVRWLSPAEGADVGERFDVEVEVRFRASEATVELQRDPTNEGEPCAPLIPQRVVLDGDLGEEAIHVITFSNVHALGSSFGLQVRAVAPSTEPFVLRRGFRGEVDDALGGMDVAEPSEGFFDADRRVTLDVEASLPDEARVVSAWLEPALEAPTPRRVLAQDSRDALGRVPLARGPQVLWLEADLPGGVRRCGVGLASEPTANPDGIEISLAFEGPEPTNLDLWIYADLDDEGESRCTLEPPTGVCALAWSQLGLRRQGEEAVVLPALEGIYGVAVAPAAVTLPASAFVRVSNRNVHLGFFGPRSVIADEAQVWLAGRVLVLGGTVDLEPLDRVTVGLPADAASAW